MIRVLLADDQDLVRAGFRALLDAEQDIEVVGEADDGEQAARLAGELDARVVIPMHYGVMPHNTIEPSLFLDALRAQGAASTPHVLEIGETVLLS